MESNIDVLKNEAKPHNDNYKNIPQITLTTNNRKYLIMYAERYKTNNILPKKIDIDECLISQFKSIQDYLIVALVKALVDPVAFEIIIETQKIKLNK